MEAERPALASATVDQLQRRVSLDFIRTSGTYAVEANIRSKAPVSGWSPKDNNRERSDAVITKAAQSDSINVGVHLFGDVVDVDVDSDDPILLTALDMMLPACGHIWGRMSRPRTHRVYKLQAAYNSDEFPIMNRIKKHSAVELRGGDQSRGQYSLLPSSIHPSGEAYTWHDLHAAQATLTTTSAGALVRAIRRAIAAALIARHWTEGVRNDLTLALAGFLHRVHSLQREDDGSSIVMDKDEALIFLHSVLDLAADDEKDRAIRIRAFSSTWDKADSGAAVTGITRFAEITGDRDIVRMLYEMLSDSPNGEVLDRFLEKFAIRRNTTDVIDLDALATGAVRNSVMSRQAFVNTNSHERIDMGGNRKRIVDIFFDLSAVKRISAIDINPDAPLIYNKSEELMANAWSGFDVKPYEAEVSESDVAIFVDYVYEVLADSDDTRYKWMMAWMADIFQRPAQRPGTAIVLVGDQGAGKSMLGYSILIPIIGSNHATATNSVDRITRSFNYNFANKLFIQCDEAINNRQRATAAKLKSLVTDPIIHIEPKGVNGWDQTNLARFIFTSNEQDDALFISDGVDDRRYVVFKVSNKRAKDTPYWDTYHKWLSDRDNLARIHRFLLQHEYKPESIRRAVMTDAKVRMLQQSMTQFDEWLSTWISNNHPLPMKFHVRHWHAHPGDGRTIDRSGWPDYVHLPLLVEAYEHHCRSIRKDRPEVWSEQQMSQRLAIVEQPPEPITIRLSVVDVDDKTQTPIKMRPRLYRVPSLHSVSAYLTSKYGMQFTNHENEKETNLEPKTEF